MPGADEPQSAPVAGTSSTSAAVTYFSGAVEKTEQLARVKSQLRQRGRCGRAGSAVTACMLLITSAAGNPLPGDVSHAEQLRARRRCPTWFRRTHRSNRRRSGARAGCAPRARSRVYMASSPETGRPEYFRAARFSSLSSLARATSASLCVGLAAASAPGRAGAGLCAAARMTHRATERSATIRDWERGIRRPTAVETRQCYLNRSARANISSTGSQRLTSCPARKSTTRSNGSKPKAAATDGRRFELALMS